MEVKIVAKAITKTQLGSCLSRIATYFANTLSKTVNLDGVVPNSLNVVKHYGECSTAAGTAAKTVACDGFTLVAGAKIAVKFTVTNTASNPTLNVNSTGAKAIYYRGATISAGYLAQNHIYEFIYTGTNYELVGDIDTNTTYSNATTTTAGLMSAHDKAVLDNVPSSYATQAEVNQLATTATNSVSAAVAAKNDAVAAKNQAQSIADGLVSIRDTAVDTSLTISGQAADSKTVGDKFNVIGATQITNNEYLCVWVDSQNRVLFGVKADGTFTFQKGVPKPINAELDAIKARLTALGG
jgi:hypothetical protein